MADLCKTKPGPKGKLTPEMTSKIVAALKSGNTRKAACRHAGISLESFSVYMRNSPEFRMAVMQAEGSAEVGFVEVIDKAAKDGNWKAAAWWLTHHPLCKEQWKQADEFDWRKLTIDQLVALAERCQQGIESAGDRAALEEVES